MLSFMNGLMLLLGRVMIEMNMVQNGVWLMLDYIVRTWLGTMDRKSLWILKRTNSFFLWYYYLWYWYSITTLFALVILDKFRSLATPCNNINTLTIQFE